MERTVIVVGGGPGGCAAALAARGQGLRCVLLERTAAPALRPGEHLAPVARVSLNQLGLWDSFVDAGHLPSPGVRSTWGSPTPRDREYIFNPHGHGWNLDRPRFDAWLLRAARAAGVEVYTGAQLERLDALADPLAGWEVEVTVRGRRSVLRGDFLVDASGRASAVARKLGSRRVAYDHQVALAGWLSSRRAGADDATLLIEAVPRGWWYAAPLPGGALAATLITDPPLPLSSDTDAPGARRGRRDDLQALWRRELAATTLVRELVPNQSAPANAAAGRPGRLSHVRVGAHPAGAYHTDPPCGPNWLAVGDAFAGFDPLASEGIARALASGIAAASAIARHFSGDATALTEYTAAMTREFQRHLAGRAFYYGHEQRWPDQPYWRRRQTSGE